MKNFKMFFSFLLGVTIFLFNVNAVNAASGTAHIHYYNEGTTDRSLTYSQAKGHLQSMGYTVKGYDHYGFDSGLQNQLTSGQVFVVHNHGIPGVQYTGNSTYENAPRIIVGTSSQNSINSVRVSSLLANSMSSMKMVILYGCSTGLVTTASGNLPASLVQKGAKAAVAWKVTTYVDTVNEWNRLFFEKAKTDTIVESFRHADYWLEQIWSADDANIMKNNRNEQGNINAYIN